MLPPILITMAPATFRNTAPARTRKAPPASIFRVTAARMPGSAFQITFNTVIGKTYRVESAAALTGPWTVLENHIPGTAAPVQITDAFSSASTSRFYRVVVE